MVSEVDRPRFLKYPTPVVLISGSTSGVRTDRRLFRRLYVADPRLIELRAWSRLAEELTEERVRLSNRVSHELWRYYPQIAKLTDDVAATWFLELWTRAPTPAKARQLRKSTIEQLLKQHRIRRVDAEAGPTPVGG
jgi:hypothetical protein